MDLFATLRILLEMPPRQRVGPLTELANSVADAIAAGEDPGAKLVAAVVAALLELLPSYGGPARERMKLGEALGRLGDPRLRTPDDADYWALVELDSGPVHVGRYPVTVAEFKTFVADGGFENDAFWSADGLAWRNSGRRLWPELASRAEVAHLVIPNQPVVGVNFWEAEAYAHAHGARMLGFVERLEVVRGEAKRPYPWGEPFGQGNANTAEEVLGKPCAVGLFEMDQTPEGVADLAGNVAEWTGDLAGDGVVVAPGSYEQPSMASWAKARSVVPPDFRAEDRGFRLARD